MATCHVSGSCLSLSSLLHCEVDALQMAFLCLRPLLFQHACASALAREGLCNLIRCLAVYSFNKSSVLLVLQTAAELPVPRMVGDGECSEFNKCPLAQLLFLPHKGRLQCRGKHSVLPAAMPWVAGGPEGGMVWDSRTNWRKLFSKRDSIPLPETGLFYERNGGAECSCIV